MKKKKKNYHNVKAQNLQYECLEALNPITYVQIMAISCGTIHSFIHSTNKYLLNARLLVLAAELTDIYTKG